MIRCRYLVAMTLLFMSHFNLMGLELKLICDDWPPYEYAEGDEITGFSVEITKIVLSRMGIDLAPIRIYPWKRAVVMLEDGEVDGLISASYSPDWAVFAHYPDEPMIVTPWVIWVNRNSGYRYRSFEDLKGRKVGVVRGYSYTGDFWDYIRSESYIFEHSTDDRNLQLLGEGKLDFVAAELGNGFSLIRKYGIGDLAPEVSFPIKRQGLYVLSSRDRVSSDFVRRYSEELRLFKKESGYRRLYNAYFSENN